LALINFRSLKARIIHNLNMVNRLKLVNSLYTGGVIFLLFSLIVIVFAIFSVNDLYLANKILTIIIYFTFLGLAATFMGFLIKKIEPEPNLEE